MHDLHVLTEDDWFVFILRKKLQNNQTNVGLFLLLYIVERFLLKKLMNKQECRCHLTLIKYIWLCELNKIIRVKFAKDNFLLGEYIIIGDEKQNSLKQYLTTCKQF